MVQPKFPHPDPNLPLRYLPLYDGLEIDSEKWRDERNYQRSRQNLHYQSVQQPGIVCGLRVRVLKSSDSAIPEDAQRDNVCWVEIEPGIAIDVHGYPIVIPKYPQENRVFPIRDPSDNEGEEFDVYLYIVRELPEEIIAEPREQKHQLANERYIIDQQTEPLTEKEVELCRCRLRCGDNQLSAPEDFFWPDINELDFRYRVYARWRAPRTVSMAVLVCHELRHTSDRADFDSVSNKNNLQRLLASVEALHPEITGNPQVGHLTTLPETAELPMRWTGSLGGKGVGSSQVFESYNILYIGLAYQDCSLEKHEIKLLREYLDSGGVLWVEVLPKVSGFPPPNDPVEISIEPIAEKPKRSFLGLMGFGKDAEESDLEEVAPETRHFSNPDPQPPDDTAPPDRAIVASLEQLYPEGDRAWKRCEPDDPLLTSPFLFACLPRLSDERDLFVDLWNLKNIVLCVGKLSATWDVDSNLERHDIRNAQELAINILHFSWMISQGYWQAVQTDTDTAGWGIEGVRD